MNTRNCIVGLVLLAMLLALLTTTPSVAQAQAGFQSFTVSPSTSVPQGTLITISVVFSQPSGLTLEVDEQPIYAQLGSTISATYDTSNLTVGTHSLCASGRVTTPAVATTNLCVSLVIQPALTNQPGETNLSSGGVNIGGFCQVAGYDQVTVTLTDAYSWTCGAGAQAVGIDMYAVCQWQYGGLLPYPGLADASDAYTWSCNRNSTYVAPRANQVASPYSAVKVGDTAVVVNSPSSSTLLCKTSPERGKHNVQSQLTNGAQLYIVSGPIYDDGLYFWAVTGACDGWVADGQAGEPWIEPITSGSEPTQLQTPQLSLACQQAEPVKVGTVAAVLPGTPNNVRSGPNVMNTAIESMAAGTSFFVMGGPICSGEYRFWQINYQGLIGWTADGDGTHYWIGPTSARQ